MPYYIEITPISLSIEPSVLRSKTIANCSRTIDLIMNLDATQLHEAGTLVLIDIHMDTDLNGRNNALLYGVTSLDPSIEAESIN